MYTFPDDIREHLESSQIPFVYYERIDSHSRPILVSDGFCRLIDLDREQAIEHMKGSAYEKIHPDDYGKIVSAVHAFVKKEAGYDVIYRSKHSLHDEYHFIHSLGTWHTMPDGTELMYVLYLDLTHCFDASAQLNSSYALFQEDLVYKDSLTGIPNFNYLKQIGNERLHAVRTRGNTPVIIFSDVYSLRSYNNHYGFSEGDRLIQLVAETLESAFPEALLTRGPEDDFIMITDLCEKDELVNQLTSVNQQIRQKALGNTLGIRSGIHFVDADQDLADALDSAKHALSRVKHDINQAIAFFSPVYEEIYWRNRYIVESFDTALEQGWIKIYYQALFRVKTEKTAAAEALARWEDPEKGLLSPAIFIPVLQKFHLLYRLDLYIFEKACQNYIERYEKGLPHVPVSINFSRQDFDHVNVVEELNRIYDKYELDRFVDKSYFIVEITEQDVAKGSENFHDQLRKIRESGFCVWLDDFGSGYSAINMFSKFKFTLIKYDMELIRRLEENNGANRLVLKQLVLLSKQLGIHTLIEGIENEKELDFIREINCEFAQGYFFHKPEPLDSITMKLKSGEKYHPSESREEREEENRLWLA